MYFDKINDIRRILYVSAEVRTSVRVSQVCTPRSRAQRRRFDGWKPTVTIVSGQRETRCKVGRVSQERALSGLDEELRERWESGSSLRDLETYVNEQVLAGAMQRAGLDPVDGEAANLYRVLTDDDVSAGERVTATSRLEREGVDLGAVRADFVSYGTVRTHLRDCLGVETSRDRSIDADEARRTVLRLVSRTEAVTERTVERLTDAGILSIPEPSVGLSLRVACGACGDEYTFSDLLAHGGCSCEGED